MSSDRTERVLAHISANVRRIRERKKMTQEHLAELAELDIRTVQRIEAGELNASATHLAAIAEALGISPGTLFREARKLPKRGRGRPQGTKDSAPRRRR